MSELTNGEKLEIVVISLPTASGRREHMLEQLQGFSVPWRIFDAGTQAPQGLPYEERQALIHRGRPLQPGELGCFGSHLACLREFVERGATEFVVVVEDDIYLDPSFPYPRLPQLMSVCGIEYMRLHSTFMRPYRFIGYLWRYRQLVRFVAPVFGTCAYVISKRGARRFLASLRSVVRPVDDELDRFWHNNLPLYAIYPPPVIEQFGSSSIPKPNPAPHVPGGRERKRYLVNRISELLRRRIGNLRLHASDRLMARKVKDFIDTGQAS